MPAAPLAVPPQPDNTCCIPHGWQPDANLLPAVISCLVLFSLSLLLFFFYGGMSYPSSATGSCVSAATSPVGTRAHAALLFVHHMLAVPACPPRLSTLFKPGEGVILFWFNRENGS